MFHEQPSTIRRGKIRGKDIDLMGCDFAVDTALSWDGNFPKPGKGDYLVTLGDVNKGNAQVIVSRRYVAALTSKTPPTSLWMLSQNDRDTKETTTEKSSRSPSPASEQGSPAGSKISKLSTKRTLSA